MPVRLSRFAQASAEAKQEASLWFPAAAKTEIAVAAWRSPNTPIAAAAPVMHLLSGFYKAIGCHTVLLRRPVCALLCSLRTHLPDRPAEGTCGATAPAYPVSTKPVEPATRRSNQAMKLSTRCWLTCLTVQQMLSHHSGFDENDELVGRVLQLVRFLQSQWSLPYGGDPTNRWKSPLVVDSPA